MRCRRANIYSTHQLHRLRYWQDLKKGKLRTMKLTIPEGFTRFDIAKRIAEKFPQDQSAGENAALKLMEDVFHSLKT
jgi:cell division protein YceG involved in septum cleavage